MPFQFRRLEIPELVLVELRRFEDQRGFFMETYKRSEFVAHGIAESFVQDNYSRSARGVLRGLHFQEPPRAQGKLVIAVLGGVFDVAVDIRLGSPTYGRWVWEVLSAENGRMLYIPPGFAHGFCVSSEVADFVYKVTDEYAPECDAGIRWDDPAIGIDWPVVEPIVSPKDAVLPLLEEAGAGFVYKG